VVVAAAPADIDEYLATISPPARQVVSRLRDRIHELVPGAQETISYQIPTFTVDGRRFVHLAGWKAHLSLYPRPDDPTLDAELEPFESGRGTLSSRSTGRSPGSCSTGSSSPWPSVSPARNRACLLILFRPPRPAGFKGGSSPLPRTGVQTFCGNPRLSPPWLGSSQREVITLPRVKKLTPSMPWAWLSPNREFFQPPKE
jgi:hypothetical protein